MMVHQTEELGLSLSLSLTKGMEKNNDNTKNHHHISAASASSSSSLQLNLMPSLLSPSPSTFNPLHNSWNIHQHQYQYQHHHQPTSSSASDRNLETCRVETRSLLKGIDVNRLPPSTAEMEEEAGVSSPNSTLSSVSGKRSHDRSDLANADYLIDCSRSDDEDGDNSRKKLRLSKDQSTILEESFKEHNTLNPKQKLALAKRLGLTPRQVEVWFQNRRARTKLKQTEVDCEFLKRCCENLTEENRRLQKEVQELRALKLSPQFYMHMTPPTTLTMCPSCEHVAVPPSATSVAGPSSTTAEPPPSHQMNRNQRVPFSPWASPPIVHRPFDALHLRS